MEWVKGDVVVSDDSRQFDLDAIHEFLTNSYWAKGRSKETVQRTINASFCLGLFEHDRQIGFARAITDECTHAYLCDVYVLESYRNAGLGHFLMKCLFAHPRLQKLKWVLKTTNAKSLYADFGFKEIDSPTGWMVRAPEQ